MTNTWQENSLKSRIARKSRWVILRVEGEERDIWRYKLGFWNEMNREFNIPALKFDGTQMNALDRNLDELWSA